MSLATPAFQKNFKGLMAGLTLRTCLSNLKSITLAVLAQLAFNAQQCRGHVSLATPIFQKNFKGLMSGMTLGTFLSNLESIALTMLAQLAFNAHNFKGSRVPDHAPFSEKCKGAHVRTDPENMLIKFEMHNFNRIGAISI